MRAEINSIAKRLQSDGPKPPYQCRMNGCVNVSATPKYHTRHMLTAHGVSISESDIYFVQAILEYQQRKERANDK